MCVSDTSLASLSLHHCFVVIVTRIEPPTIDPADDGYQVTDDSPLRLAHDNEHLLTTSS